MRITFHMDNGAFHSDDSCDKLSSGELESVLHEIRALNNALEGELMKRDQRRRSDQSGQTGKCCDRLHNTVRELVIRERPDGQAAKNVGDAVEILAAPLPEPATRIYQTFLFDVLYHCRRGLALLCAASLGKKRISNMATKDRLSLLAYIKDAQASLDFPMLGVLANEFSIPSADSLYPFV